MEVTGARVALAGSACTGDSFGPAVRNVTGGSCLFLGKGAGEGFKRMATFGEEGVGKEGRVEEGASNL
jgi:hypothetical protein